VAVGLLSITLLGSIMCFIVSSLKRKSKSAVELRDLFDTPDVGDDEDELLRPSRSAENDLPVSPVKSPGMPGMYSQL
jgi:hypothetical protein